MDREQAFVEYGRILKDTADWISFGYRMDSGDEETIILPETIRADSALKSHSDTPSPENASTANGAAALNSSSGVIPSAGGFSSRNAAESGGASFAGASARIRLRSDSQNPSPGLTDSSPASLSQTPDSPAALHPGGTSAASVPSFGRQAPSSPELQAVAEKAAQCRACNLHLTRENTVPGVGSVGATLMIVTPPPVDGAPEGGGPLAPYEFEYLEKWLAALALNPSSDIFITPAVKCRTPGGRPPHAEEAAACSGYLREQYKIIRPKAVLALGDAACGVLTGSSADFPKLVGKDWTWGAVPALVLWTPSEVLANPSRLRRPVWDALKRLKDAWNAVGTGI